MRGMPEIADKKLCFELFCHPFALLMTSSNLIFCHSALFIVIPSLRSGQRLRLHQQPKNPLLSVILTLSEAKGKNPNNRRPFGLKSSG